VFANASMGQVEFTIEIQVSSCSTKVSCIMIMIIMNTK